MPVADTLSCDRTLTLSTSTSFSRTRCSFLSNAPSGSSARLSNSSSVGKVLAKGFFPMVQAPGVGSPLFDPHPVLSHVVRIPTLFFFQPPRCVSSWVGVSRVANSCLVVPTRSVGFRSPWPPLWIVSPSPFETNGCGVHIRPQGRDRRGSIHNRVRGRNGDVPSQPSILGGEGSGRIWTVGEGRQGWRPNDAHRTPPDPRWNHNAHAIRSIPNTAVANIPQRSEVKGTAVGRNEGSIRSTGP